jgi:MOSC domain-containing protein
VENAWVGHILAIGDEVRLRVTDPCPRCVMTTLPQGDLPRDLGILRAAADHNRVHIPFANQEMPSVGVYAVVERGGRIRRGDQLRLE